MIYIPRREMPQVDEKDQPRMVAEAWLDRHQPTFDVIDPELLHVHQRINFNRLLTMPVTVKLKPIIISQDLYVLDGNHRWWKHKKDGDPAISVIRLGLDFDLAIDWLLRQPYVYTLATAGKVERN